MENTITGDEMLAFLENERLEREQIATQEINEVLAKYHCDMDAEITFGANGKVNTQIKIVARSIMEQRGS